MLWDSLQGDSVIAGMGAVTRVTSMGTLVVFGFLKGFQPIADALTAVITVFMALHLHKELSAAKAKMT